MKRYRGDYYSEKKRKHNCCSDNVPLATNTGADFNFFLHRIFAHMAGIKIFVTGGIGGVHRGVEETMDISADLIELGQTPVAVVSAGVKVDIISLIKGAY